MARTLARTPARIERREVKIDAVISLREAGQKLRKDRRYLRGLIDGLKIPVQEVGAAVLITAPDFDRLSREIPPRPRKRKRRRSLAAAAG